MARPRPPFESAFVTSHLPRRVWIVWPNIALVFRRKSVRAEKADSRHTRPGGQEARRPPPDLVSADKHTDQPTSQYYSRKNCPEHRNAQSGDPNDAALTTANHVQRVAQTDGCRTENDPRTEELERMPSAEQSGYPQAERRHGLQGKRDAPGQRKVSAMQCGHDPSGGEGQRKDVVVHRIQLLNQ